MRFITRKLAAPCLVAGATSVVGVQVARAAWPDGYEGRVAMLEAVRHDMIWPGIMYDAQEVRRRYTQACELKSSTACLWESWQTSTGGDLQKAATALAAKCATGEPLSCVVVGWSYVAGPNGGIRRDSKSAGAAVAKFQEACDKAYAAGCTSLGELYIDGVGVTRDLDRAGALVDEGCKAEDWWGCFQLGRVAELAETPDYEAAADNYRKACKKNIPHACVALGSLMERGAGMPAQPKKAVEVYSEACKGKFAGGCSELGRIYSEGRYVKKSPAVALGLYKTACDGGDAKACFGMALMYEEGGAGEEGVANAVAIYRNACNEGVAGACARLGSMYLGGRGVEKDEEKAKILIQKACEAGDGDGCDIIGAMYESGKGMAMNLTRAVNMYQEGCNQKSGAACFHLSKLYETGKGVDQSAARALALTRQACDLGHDESCNLMARRYMTGNGVQKDMAKAAQMFEQACHAGHGDGCATLGVMYQKGEGVGADLDKSVTYFKDACALDSGAGCYAIGQAYETGAGAEVDFSAALESYQKACDLDYERGCSAAGPVTFQARYEGMVKDALRSDVCQVWSVDVQDPDRTRVLAEVARDTFRLNAGPRQGQALRVTHLSNKFDQSDNYVGDSVWKASGDGAALDLTFREVWNPRLDTIDNFPGDVCFSPDRSGKALITYSREEGAIKRDVENPKCRFAEGFVELAAEQCSEVQALLAAQLLTQCKGE